MISHIRLAAALAFLGIITQIASVAHARTACTPAEARRAEGEAGIVHSWTEVYSSYKRFAHCDDGAIAEGYSDAIGRLLARHWAALPVLSRLTRSDYRFEAFVLRHIDATLAPDDLGMIAVNAGRRCSPGTVRLCRLIRNRALTALKELGQARL